MKGKRKMRVADAVVSAALAAFLLAAAPSLRAQARITRYLGTVTAISGDTLTVRTDTGEIHQIQVPFTALLERIEPGQTNLSKAEKIEFSELAAGDRVLVALNPNATGAVPQALEVVAIKHADVAKRQAEAEAWDQGVHGLVKSVDAATGVIVVNTRSGAVTKEVTIDTTRTTVLKRYATGSVRFDQAQPGPISAIHPGDQLWARGTKNADGTVIAADAVVSGSFRSIPGTVLSVDTANSTLTVKDLITKKPVTIRITADSQLHRLDENVAKFLAAHLTGNQGGAGGRPAYNGPTGEGAGTRHGFSQGGGNAPGRGDLETVLERAPAIQLGSLKKGDAVMIVATEDAAGVNAIKLVAGVEPLLQAPEAQDLLASWSLNQGEPEMTE